MFEGHHFDREVIILCVRWYLRFKLSLRDLVEMMAERGLSMAHTTIMRWVQRYAPEFEKLWRRFARAFGRSWRVDETYVKVRGEKDCINRRYRQRGRVNESERAKNRTKSKVRAKVEHPIGEGSGHLDAARIPPPVPGNETVDQAAVVARCPAVFW